jgi:hypothetical protein
VTGLLRRRAAGQRTLLAAAVAVLLPALVLVTLIREHSAVAERDGVRHALGAIPADRRTVSVRYAADLAWSGDAQSRAALAEETARRLTDAFGGVRLAVDQAIGSVRYAVVDPGSGTTEAVFFESATRLPDHVKLLSGIWPAAVRPDSGAAAPFQALVPAGAAAKNHWKAGDVITADAKLGGPVSKVTVAGVYQPTDPQGQYWQRLDPFRAGGRQQQEITVYGPLLVDPSVTAGATLTIKELAFLADPDYPSVSVSQVAALGGRLAAFDAWVSASTGLPDTQAQVTEGVSSAVVGIDADRAISARLIWLPVIELTLLALTAMVLTTRLLAEHRRETDGLLRARGASVSRLVSIGLTEGLALALPAAAVAPFAARLLLRQISDSSASPVGGVPITADQWAVAVGGAVAAAALLGFAGVRAAGSFVDARRIRGRSSARTAVQRTGADAVVAALGAGSLWELAQFGSGSAHAGSLGWPLVVAPSVLLLAGALLSLRLLPVAVGGVEWVASRRRGAVSALAGWRVGRTARFYAAPMILLIMAVAVGVQAVVFVGSADSSARDQAAHTVGADVRISGLPQSRSGWDSLLAGTPGAGPGFVGIRDGVAVGGGASSVQVSALGVDPERAKGVVPLRGDLAAGGWAGTVGALAADGWDAHGLLPGVALPGRPKTLSVDVVYRSASRPSALGAAQFQAVVVDAYGLGSLVDLGGVAEPDGVAHTLVGKLQPAEGASLAYPLRVDFLRIRYTAPLCPAYNASPPFSDKRCYTETGPPLGDAEHVTIAAGRMLADTSLVAAPAGMLPVSGDAADRSASAPAGQSGGTGLASGATIGPGAAGLDLFTLQEDSGWGLDTRSENDHVVRWAAGSGPDPATVVPVIASRGMLDALRLKVGDTLPVPVFGVGVKAHFVGVVEHMPGQDGDQPSMMLPIGLLDLRFARANGDIGTAEWWGSAAPGTTPGRLAERMTQATAGSGYLRTATVLDRQTVTRAISRDPLRSGVKLTLMVASGAALLFILIGFALHSVIAVRERATELALLNALGLSRRKTAVMLLAEQAMLVLLGAAAGGVLAAVTIRSVLPLMILTDLGAAPVPKPIAVFDVPLLAAAGAASAVFLLATVAVVVLTRRRSDFGKALRMGEDR